MSRSHHPERLQPLRGVLLGSVLSLPADVHRGLVCLSGDDTRRHAAPIRGCSTECSRTREGEQLVYVGERTYAKVVYKYKLNCLYASSTKKIWDRHLGPKDPIGSDQPTNQFIRLILLIVITLVIHRISTTCRRLPGPVLFVGMAQGATVLPAEGTPLDKWHWSGVCRGCRFFLVLECVSTTHRCREP